MRNNKTVWKTGTIVEKYGQLHYLVKLDDGYVLKRHIDQLKATNVQKRKVHFDPDIDNSSTEQPENRYQHYSFPAYQQYQYNPGNNPTLQQPPQQNLQPSQENIPSTQEPPQHTSIQADTQESSQHNDNRPITHTPSQPAFQDNNLNVRQPQVDQSSMEPQHQPLRRSQRSRTKPSYLRDYVNEID